MNTTKYKIKTEIRNGNRIAVITPSQAERIFNERLPNRPFSLDTAKIYAEAMNKGHWKPCSQISFCNGRLDDGQHRMMASVLSGKPYEGTLYEHDDPDTFAVFDSGNKRTNAHVLAIEKKKNSTALGAVLQLLEKVNSKEGLPNQTGGATRKAIPTYEILDVLNKYEGIENSVNLVCSYKKHYRIPIASTCILHYYLNKKVIEANLSVDEYGRTLADRFIVDKLLKGLELNETDPVYVFRRYMDKIRARTDALGFQAITHYMVLMGGIQTWNKYVKGKTARVFKLPDSPHMPKILLP
jgi:hypothetical protein